MSVIKANLYFTYEDDCDMGSHVLVDTETGEFDEEPAFNEVRSLMQDDSPLPRGRYLQIGGQHFDVERVRAHGTLWRVTDVEWFREVVAQAKPVPDRRTMSIF